MDTLHSVTDVRRARLALRGTLGLVPTMGALHDGHLSLMRRARDECDHVAASIFVNPLQFGQGENFDRYPRQLERDTNLLQAEGVALVWAPAPEQVYPLGFQTTVDVTDVSQPLDGRARPGHFRGVATVVAKLLNVFTPERAYFGAKDAQQVVVIERMVADLNFPVDVVVCPTVREADGLAMSSRNVYLSADERRAAPVLYRALQAARSAYEQGERDANALRALLAARLASEPLARVEVASVADPVTLVELERVPSGALVSLAVWIGNTRLIDNITLGARRPRTGGLRL